MIAALVTGPRYAHAHDASQQMVDFADAHGIWEAWLEELRVDTPEWRAYSADGWKHGASAEVASSAARIGWAGTLGQTLLREWEIDAQVHVFVALLEPLIHSTERTLRASLHGRFPPVRRDLAFFVPENVTHLHLERALTIAGGERLGSIELFDVYAGPGTPTGMKSMAFALRFQHPERTMTEPEVQAIQERMVTAVATECGGRLREK